MPGGDDPTAPVRPEELARVLADAPTVSAAAPEPERAGPTLAPDTRLRGRYRIVRFIARGGMGEVYEAEDTALHTRVALKTVRPHIADDPLALTRFRREIQVARTVTHPNVCRVFDLDHHETGDRPLAFYTMEYLDGETLAARLRRGSPGPAEAHRILDDVLAAIAAAHGAGVIHRDLKPANIMLRERGRAVITDFGLALPVGTMIGGAPGASAGGPVGAASADGTSIAGTPAYMAPELVAGAPPSVATDLYALGVCMFELQHGRLPAPVSTRHLPGDSSQPLPPPLTGEGAAWRDRRWERATRACLAEAPGARPASAEALRAMVRPPRRVRGAIVAGGAAALAIGVIVVAARDGDRAASTAPAAPLAPAARTAPPPLDARAPAFAPGPLTATGGCEYAPAFLDEDTLVYDHSTTTVMDVYRLRAGGTPEQLTRAETQEWRALPGLTPGEIVYVVSDVTGGGTSRLAARDLATGQERTIAAQVSPAVAAAGGAYYYVSNEGARLRRVTGDQDEIAITMPDDAIAQTIVASHDGRALVAVGETASSPPMLCVIDLTTGEGDCPELPRLLNARAAFAPDDRSIVYATEDGLRRRWLDGEPARDELVVPKVRASGVAVSPAGALVWTECMPRGVLHDVAARPHAALGPDDRVAAPVVGPGGEVAYVRRRRELVVRGADGAVRAVGTPLPAGSQMSAPAWDATGTRLAVTVTSDEPGLYVYDATRFVPPSRVTVGRAHTSAAWLGEALLFNQWDGERPRIYRVPLDGGAPQLAMRLDRLLIGVDHRRGEVLLSSPDETRLYWWDPRTGRQRAGPPALADGIEEAYDQALAPGGRWLALQLGRQGHRLYRVRLDDRGAAVGAPEPVWTAPSGMSMTDVAIGDDGAVIVAAIEWRGELYAADVTIGP